MINATVFDDLARAFEKMLPPGAADLRNDFESNARSAFKSAFSKMDLVTREEFDVQSKVLQRTREKLEALEARVALLEAGGPVGGKPIPGAAGGEEAGPQA